MAALAIGALWAMLVLYLLTRALRQFRAHRLTALAAPPRPPQRAAVAIVVPMRNEIANIERCLEGLEAQRGLGEGSSILFVDDNSADGTPAAVAGAIARGAPVGLAAAGALPPGWMGKPHACWRGAEQASAPWLCFIDCDVRIAPDLVAAALATAARQRIDMLSLRPFQELGSFWERVVFPAGLIIIACAKPRRAARDRAASEEMANGQFILIRRDVYLRVGGHRAVRAEVCEDKRLAALVKEHGFRFRVFAAEHLARTRMYRDFNSLWEGFSKNAIDILGSAGATLWAAAAGFLASWCALALPGALAAAFWSAPSTPAAIGLGLALCGSAAAIGIQLATARHLQIPAAYGLLCPLGCTVAAALACRSVLSHLTGRVTWKGRTYEIDRKVSLSRS
jgi:chlorobactene glucosyltransferase